MVDMGEIAKRINSAAEYIKGQTAFAPKMGIVLGSGLGDFCDEIKQECVISFKDIPGFPRPMVEGHTGELIFGTYNDVPMVAMRGRVHYYEGYSQQEITIPVRVMRLLGVDTLMLTNAAGGVNLSFSQGALMLIRDHINFSGSNPLIGQNMDEFGTRFPDMGGLYTPALCDALKEKAEKAGVQLQEGVYMMYSGPSYETHAEIRAFRGMGADAVGMSTVPEAIVARHAGMRVLGVSCITNMAAGVLPQPLSHAEVVETSNRVKGDFIKLLSLAVDCVRENPAQALFKLQS